MTLRRDCEPVIGLEVHAQLLTAAKIFCGCSHARSAREPNTHICPVCLGTAGRAAGAERAGGRARACAPALALGCAIRRARVFARKNYFYPDLPKGYQISQYDRAAARAAASSRSTSTASERDDRHRRASTWRRTPARTCTSVGAASRRCVDLNRAGVPLIEIVSEPDMRSADEAAAYLRALRDDPGRSLGVCDGNMEEGSLPLRRQRVGAPARRRPTLGTRVEIKNINSFRFVRKRSTTRSRGRSAVLEAAARSIQETRLWTTTRRARRCRCARRKRRTTTATSPSPICRRSR